MDKLVLEYKIARTSGKNKKKPPLIRAATSEGALKPIDEQHKGGEKCR